MAKSHRKRARKVGEDAGKEFIPGIFNYCDRWCERCAFTARCRVFDMSEGGPVDPRTRDINNKEFWQKLDGILKETLRMIRADAERQGIDLDSIDLSEEMQVEERREEQARAHSCAVAAKTYADRVSAWCQANESSLERLRDEFAAQALAALPGTDPEADAAAFVDAIEVILYHQHQIWVKLMRALDGLLEGVPREIADMPKDSDGSAKVALIGIDRSIASWGTLLKQFPEQERDILGTLVLLERLRRETEATFPDARAFHRVGFDDAPVEVPDTWL